MRSIVELGIDLGGRTQRILEIAGWRNHARPLRYTGIDLFEARPACQTGCSLKRVFAALRLPGVHTQLVPGDPQAALARVANSLASTDLLLISADQDRESLERAWTWVPRMLTAQSLVFLEESSGKEERMHWRRLEPADVLRLADAAAKSARRAA